MKDLMANTVGTVELQQLKQKHEQKVNELQLASPDLCSTSFNLFLTLSLDDLTVSIYNWPCGMPLLHECHCFVLVVVVVVGSPHWLVHWLLSSLWMPLKVQKFDTMMCCLVIYVLLYSELGYEFI